MQTRLYFHSPCFDGIASAVLAWDFLEAKRRWATPDIVAINYDRRDEWPAMDIGERSAVVDFHYHRQAWFWADHHQTTFLSDSASRDFVKRRVPMNRSTPPEAPVLIFDESAGSCAGLLWRRLLDAFEHRNPDYAELVRWAEKIDAAAYDDVEEAVDGDAPALRINASLAVADDTGYGPALVRSIRDSTLEEVASRPGTRALFAKYQRLSRRGMQAFKAGAQVFDQAIVAFKYETREPRDMIVSRYAAYQQHPEARYSLVLTASPERVTIRANRNPWIPGGSLPLGHIFRSVGGGGHQVVGAVVLEDDAMSRADRVFEDVLAELRRQLRTSSSEVGS